MFRPPADEVDWEAVYRQELPRVYNFFRYRLWDEQLAEDLTATTFEHAWRARGGYCADRASVTTWLFAIARHVAIDHLRRWHVEMTLESIEAMTADPPMDEQVENAHDLAQLARLVSGLDDCERELISLKYGADLSNREIARLTGLSETNVGVSLYRLIQRLRGKWETVS